MIRPISISLSPNTEPDDVWLAFRLLFQPWRWKREYGVFSTAVENTPQQLEQEFARCLGVKCAFAFNSGRSALLAILDSLGFEKGSEILLQAFTCNAVPNPVMWTGLRPVYVDCNEDDFNIDVEDLRRKVTPKSRAVIVQHTFGLPANMDRVMELCSKYNLVLIEDCAHALGAAYKGKQVGTFGKAAFFSFSRDKVISSVYGGTVITNDGILAEKLRAFQKTADYPSASWVAQQLLHPPALNWKILPTYRVLGKYVLVAFQVLHVLSKAVHWKEKRGMRPGYFPKRMPNALALLAIRQLEKLERFNEHRKKIARQYYKALAGTSFELPKSFEERENIFLRFTVKHPKAHEIIQNAWAQNLLLGDWYTSPVAPDDTRLEAVQYKKESCPKAEKLAKITLNLPTHINITAKHADQIIQFLKSAG